MAILKYGDFLKEELSESFKSICIPSKIIGYKEDYIINKIEKDKFEIFNKDGDFEEVKKGDSLYIILDKIIELSKPIKYTEYRKEFSNEHSKYYNTNDWDSDLVVTEVPADLELPISKIKLLFK